MTTNQIRFDDGAAYARYMGMWSKLAGETFLDWVAPQSGLRWLDVGCGVENHLKLTHCFHRNLTHPIFA
ncbi:MAG TPA: hypothetical protein VIF82_15825 [Burkholderiaceae bacterium]|jgi:hypothetical protein